MGGVRERVAKKEGAGESIHPLFRCWRHGREHPLFDAGDTGEGILFSILATQDTRRRVSLLRASTCAGVRLVLRRKGRLYFFCAPSPAPLPMISLLFVFSSGVPCHRETSSHLSGVPRTVDTSVVLPRLCHGAYDDAHILHLSAAVGHFFLI